MWFLVLVALISGDNGPTRKALLHPYETKESCEADRARLTKEMAIVENHVMEAGSVCVRIEIGKLT